MKTVTVTPQQATLLAEAVQASQAAVRHATVLLAAMTAGLVPEGATLADINADTGVLSFDVGPSTPPSEPAAHG